MNKSIFKIFIAILTVIFINNCSVGDYTTLWPTGAEENSEVVIREIPDESFDPEDTEEIAIARELVIMVRKMKLQLLKKYQK